MKKFISNSENETINIAANLAKSIRGGVVALTGELGAGKTVFAKGFAKGLGIKERIISPTFILIRSHKVPNSPKIFYHIDLYRLEHIRDLKTLGLDEVLSNPNNIVLIEWAEKARSLLPKNAKKISIEKEDGKRIITVF